MDTAVISIGNSDDKLPQRHWALFVEEMSYVVARTGLTQHFHGCSPTSAPWQNACWVLGVEDEAMLVWLRTELSRLASKFQQNSIALTVGNTEFVSG